MPSHPTDDIKITAAHDQIMDVSFLHSQIEIVQNISKNIPLSHILEAIANCVYKQSNKQIIACILLADLNAGNLIIGAAPQLPADFKSATHSLDGKSPWGKAILTKTEVIIEDINTDPVWKGHKDETLFKMDTCWSLPLINSAGGVLGALVLYAKKPKKISNYEMQLIDLMKGLSILAIESSSVAHLKSTLSDTLRELNESNYLLKVSNEELQQFAYIANHDLQEPLRKIKAFSNILDESQSLTEKGYLYLNKIISASERMSNIVNGVLNLTKLAKAGAEFTPTNLNQILETVLEDFKEDFDANHATIIKTVLPVIPAVPIQMSMLFSNLISNALKFSKKDTPLTIAISLAELSRQEIEGHEMLKLNRAYCKITCSDNGIGFNPKFTDQIFNLFQRLNDRSYSGAGIGLALCKRIVNYHGGVIFAESEEHAGSQLHIILPTSRN